MFRHFTVTHLLSALLAGWMAAIAVPAQAQPQVLTLTLVETIEIGDHGLEADDAAPALAVFGPFRVIDPQTAEMRGLVGSDTPQDFAAMRQAFPELHTLRMVECPGSDDDSANLALARMVRAARIDTVVPAGGSVRSGAVELFLAGVRRQADSRAEFAVHSWQDELGREADDLAADDPVHREYLDFYTEMGISEDQAQRFYALTNSVSFEEALYLAPLQLADMGLLEIL